MPLMRTVPRWAVVALVILACLALMSTRLPFLFAVSHSRWLYDLAAFHAAASAVAHGESPYHMDVLARYADGVVTNVFAYVYTPVLAIMLQPTASWGLPALQSLWILASSIAAAFLVMLVIQPLPTPSNGDTRGRRNVNVQHAALALALIGLLPIHYTLLSGQMEIFAVLLLVAALRFHLHGRPLIAGALLGSLLIVKHAAVPILPLFLLIPPRTTPLVAIGTAFTLAGVTIALGYGSLWSEFLAWSASMSYSNAPTLGLDPHNPYNISLGSAFLRMGLRSNAWFTVPGLAVWGASITMVAIAVHRRSVHFLHAYAVIALASVLALPFAWTHHLLYLAPACAPALFTFEWNASFRNTMLGLLALMQFAPGMPLIRGAQLLGFDPTGDIHALAIAVALFAVLIVLVWTLRPLLSKPAEPIQAV